MWQDFKNNRAERQKESFMKIFKSENPDRKKVDIKQVIEKIGKRNLVIAGAVVVIGLVVYLNWFLFDGSAVDNTPPVADAGAENKAEEDNYFTVSLLNRNRARDEAIEVLQTVVDAGTSDEASASAMADIARIAAEIEKEANIEELVKSKGFAKCVAVISGQGVNIIVKGEGEALLPNEIAQIKEIAYTSANILPENVVIIEK